MPKNNSAGHPGTPLTASNEDYLKVIWQLTEWNEGPATQSDIARALELSPSTVSEAVKRLASLGLVTHHRYGTVQLTPDGNESAVLVVRKHRLIETFLFEQLGYRWDELHDEAENLEHAVSAKFIDRIDQLLNFPSSDPHGDPIPNASGKVSPVAATPLAQLNEPGDCVVIRIADGDPEILQYLEERGILPGTELETVAVRENLGIVEISVSGKGIALPLAAADHVWCAER